ncbi:MAG: saccharopine dehydrogenase family protein [Acidimicrobiales bacterium]
MIYGAYGYTGALVTALATERGEMPVLAGRDGGRLAPLAEMFQLEHRVLPLDDPDALRRGLQGIEVVAHCAGPFSSTSAPMVDACIATGTHYLDITGEIAVFEAIMARDADAKAAGMTLLPGAGFDVVPSDCLAALLAEQLPGATNLTLALRFGGRPSPGTAATAMESIANPGLMRIDGTIGAVPSHLRRRSIPFPDGQAVGTAIAWGDVSTAYHSTGIPNIAVYAAIPRMVSAVTSVAPAMRPLLRSAPVRIMLRRMAKQMPGPSAEERARTRSVLWGEVSDAAGRVVKGTMTTLNGYDVTADSVVRIATALRAGAVATGALTPSRAMGPDFARELDKIDVRVPL